MQYAQHKFALWLALAVGMVICIAGTVFAATPWHTSGYPGGVILHSGSHIAAGTVPQANANVEVRSNRYLPASVTINIGDTVIWTRVEGFHNVLANDGSFRLGESPGGAPSSSWVTASHTFTQTGTFKYHCEVHGISMSGEVIVQSNDDPITGVVAIDNGPTLLHSATNFTATVAGGTNISYTWNFGDGNSGVGKTPSHTYANTGIYTATVTATNNQGSQAASTVVHVTNAIVVVDSNFFAPISVTVNVGDTVTWVRKAGFHNVRADDDSFRLGAPDGAPSSNWTIVSQKFTQAGTVKYYCQVHGAPNGVGMSGTVIVQATSANTNLYLPVLLK
ncbi:hypothetical protein BH10CHL1_BH10CHL1_31440 [soil metagenome]